MFKLSNSSLMKMLIVGISLCFLIASFTKPILYTAGDGPDSFYQGTIFIFFLGWLGIFGGFTEFLYWFANPLYFLAMFLFLTNKKGDLFVSIIASMIAISFSFKSTITKDEGGGRIAIQSFGKGYIFWLMSILILTMGILGHRIWGRQNQHQKV